MPPNFTRFSTERRSSAGSALLISCELCGLMQDIQVFGMEGRDYWRPV